MSRPVAVVAGASGFVGRALVGAFADDGYDVRTIGRAGADATWDDGRGSVPSSMAPPCS